MAINRMMIQELAGSHAIYAMGTRIFQLGGLQIESVNSFWKNEVKIKARVYSEGETEKTVGMTIGSGRILSSRCSCMYPDLNRGKLCAHGVALAFAWIERTETNNPDSSSVVGEMLENYTRLRQLEVVSEFATSSNDPESLVHVIPYLTVSEGRLAMGFRIGSSRLYKVRDLPAMVEAFRQGSRVVYGKLLDFYHVREAFDADSIRLMDILSAIFGHAADYSIEHAKSEYRSYFSRDLSLLVADASDMGLLLHALKGELVETDEMLSRSGCLEIVSGAPKIRARMRLRNARKPELGVSVILEDQVDAYYSGEQMLIIKDGILYQLPYAYSRAMGPFIHCFPRENGQPPEAIRINGKDMVGFTVNVLPLLEKYMTIDHSEVDLCAYAGQGLKTEFFFDLTQDMELTLEIIHHYGNASFNPVKEENPRLSFRDVAGERKVTLLAGRYFAHRYSERGLLTTYDDEETAVLLAAGGFLEFAALGQVHVSDALSDLKVKRAGSSHFHISHKEEWLDLSIDLEGVDIQELSQILSHYEEKRKYYRLKDGSFVLVDPKELSVFPELMEGLMASAKDLAGGLSKIGRNRALYLSHVFDDNGISWTRDAYFEHLMESLSSGSFETAKVPDKLEGILRDYQVKGYEWLAMLDDLGFGGILADDMGLGKTLEMIALFVRTYDAGEKKPSLVVCPSSLIYNWEKEIRKFAPSLSVSLINGSSRERKELLKSGPAGQIWVTSYDLLRRDLEAYADISFAYEILDEAQYIKNQETRNAKAAKKVRAARKFALTGTPVENRLGELWSIFDFLMPGFLYSRTRFHKYFELPLAKDDKKVLLRLHQMTSPFILRRLKSEVLTELPPKSEIYLYPELGKEQQKLYKAHALALKKKLEHDSDESFHRSQATVLSAITRLREICCGPSLIDEDFKDENGKLEALVELVHTCVDGDHSILIFSQFAKMLYQIGKRLEEEKIPCFVMTGETTKHERQQLVERFSEGEVPVFLISLKAGGTGLNLTRADTVIHYDPWWNVAAQNQATDRAYRIGQERPVNVYKLIAAGTIEENILKLQSMKQNLVDQVVEGTTVSLAQLDREAIMKLL